jgi:uncharacterized protein YbjT (DUF2867 family)
VVDSTGLQIVGEGPWTTSKHGQRGTREWRKLHVGVDKQGVIVAQKLTDSTTDDAGVVPDLLDEIPDDKKIARFTGDGAYDQRSIYETCAELGARVVVPPLKNAVPSIAKHEPQRPEIERSIASRKSVAGSGRRRLDITARPGPKTPSSDTSTSSEADYAHATLTISERRPDSPARYSTACSSLEHRNLSRSETEREIGEGVLGRIRSMQQRPGVQHFVYHSVGSADQKTGIPHFDNKWRVEEAVRAAGFKSYTILRPVFFMENWLSPWFKPAIDQGEVAIGIDPETRLQQIAVADIGKYGALAFERHEDLNGREVDIAGDELAAPEIARILSSATGRQIRFVQVPIEDVRKVSEDFALMLQWFDRVGYHADVAGNVHEFGVQPTRFDVWASSQNWTAARTQSNL